MGWDGGRGARDGSGCGTGPGCPGAGPARAGRRSGGGAEQGTTTNDPPHHLQLQEILHVRPQPPAIP
eukprot:scaffold4885_cov309-Prasinococcus_capsulatus_cf.AAC.6